MLMHAPLQASDVGAGCACALQVGVTRVVKLRASGHWPYACNHIAAFSVDPKCLPAWGCPESTDVDACFLCNHMRIGVFMALLAW